MKKKTGFILMIAMIATMIACACACAEKKSDAASVKAVENAVRSIYTVDDHAMFERTEKKLLSQTGAADGTGISSGDAGMEEYIDKYAPLTTDKGLKYLLTNGIALYMDIAADQNGFLVAVTDIKVEKVADAQYQYTVGLTFTKGDKTVTAEGGGIVWLADDASGEPKLDAIKMTDDKAVGQAIAEISKG